MLRYKRGWLGLWRIEVKGWRHSLGVFEAPGESPAIGIKGLFVVGDCMDLHAAAH